MNSDMQCALYYNGMWHTICICIYVYNYIYTYKNLIYLLKWMNFTKQNKIKISSSGHSQIK